MTSREGPASLPAAMSGTTSPMAMLYTGAAALVVLFGLAWLAPVVTPFGLALFIVALAAPLFGWLGARGSSPTIALGVTITAVIAVGTAIVLLLLIGARTLADSISVYASDLTARYTDPTVATSGLRGLIPPETLAGILRSAAEILGQIATSVGVALVIAALLLLDGRRLTGLVNAGFGSGNPLFRELPALGRAAIAYFLVRIRVNIATALGLLVLMLLVGVDDPLLWAVAAFFLSFVPYLGLIVALIPPTILALAESGPLAAIAIVVGGTVLNLVAENVLEPTLTSRALELSTWLVFASFFFWVWILGPTGALLSMPITVLIVLVLQRGDRTRWLAALLAREAAEQEVSEAAVRTSA